MHLTSIAVTAILAASVSAWKIPRGTADGFYSARLDAKGVEVHTKLEEIAASIPQMSLVRRVNRRSEGQVFCGCGFDMDHGNCDAAVEGMKGQLRNEGSFSSIPGYMAYYTISNNVVAFACNRDASSYPLGPNSFASDLETITRYCGPYVAGSFQRGPDNHPLITGYMRYSDGDDFCAASTGSGAGSC